jgi:hypothetical protein
MYKAEIIWMDIVTTESVRVVQYDMSGGRENFRRLLENYEQLHRYLPEPVKREICHHASDGWNTTPWGVPSYSLELERLLEYVAKKLSNGISATDLEPFFPLKQAVALRRSIASNLDPYGFPKKPALTVLSESLLSFSVPGEEAGEKLIKYFTEVVKQGFISSGFPDSEKIGSSATAIAKCLVLDAFDRIGNLPSTADHEKAEKLPANLLITKSKADVYCLQRCMGTQRPLITQLTRNGFKIFYPQKDPDKDLLSSVIAINGSKFVDISQIPDDSHSIVQATCASSGNRYTFVSAYIPDYDQTHYTFFFPYIPGHDLTQLISRSNLQGAIAGDTACTRLVSTLNDVANSTIQIIGANMNASPEQCTERFTILANAGFRDTRAGTATEAEYSVLLGGEHDFIFSRSPSIAPSKAPLSLKMELGEKPLGAITRGLRSNTSHHIPILATIHINPTSSKSTPTLPAETPVPLGASPHSALSPVIGEYSESLSFPPPAISGTPVRSVVRTPVPLPPFHSALSPVIGEYPKPPAFPSPAISGTPVQSVRTSAPLRPSHSAPLPVIEKPPEPLAFPPPAISGTPVQPVRTSVHVPPHDGPLSVAGNHSPPSVPLPVDSKYSSNDLWLPQSQVKAGWVSRLCSFCAAITSFFSCLFCCCYPRGRSAKAKG